MRIATLNVWGLPAPFTPHGARRMRAIGRRLPTLDLDVISFQEVWTSDARRILLRAGRAAGLTNAWHTDTAFGGSGLLVLSRLPMLEVQFEPFELQGQPERITEGEYYGGKGFARVRLDTPLGPVTLINTHLHARYGRQAMREYTSLRTAQVVELAIRTRQTTDAIIATGDFNFQEGQAGYGVLTGLTGLRDTAAEVEQRQPTVYSGNPYRFGKRKQDKRIDFVFVRDGDEVGLTTQRVERVFDEVFEVDGQRAGYSNHAGVLSEIDLAQRETPLVHLADHRAVELATNLLSEGRTEAARRQRSDRALATTGLGGAVLALAALRAKPMTRRALLRRSLKAAGLVAIAPALGYSMLSEYFVPHELAGFDAVAQRLSEFDWLDDKSSIA
ncbi:MAG: endonuclease/exonuclease/phosphatase family protein [Myxococcota bacterium]